MAMTKVSMPVFTKIEPDLPECEIGEFVDSAQCCEDAEYEVRFAGLKYRVCENCMTDIMWLFENVGGG